MSNIGKYLLNKVYIPKNIFYLREVLATAEDSVKVLSQISFQLPQNMQKSTEKTICKNWYINGED